MLITNDAIAEAPTDIRAFEFIPYTLDDHKVLAKLFLILIVDGLIDREVRQAITDWIAQKVGSDGS